MRRSGAIPAWAYLLALAIAAGGVLGLVLLRLRSPVLDSTAGPVAFSALYSAAAAAGFSRAWPARPLTWAILVSSGFWAFLAFAFLSFLANGALVAAPALDAIVILVAAWVGAWLGGRASPHRSRSVAG